MPPNLGFLGGGKAEYEWKLVHMYIVHSTLRKRTRLLFQPVQWHYVSYTRITEKNWKQTDQRAGWVFPQSRVLHEPNVLIIKL